MIADRLPWYVAGPLLGLLMTGLRAAANKPFGALGGYIDIAENAKSPTKLGFRAYLLFGLVLGGVLYAATLGSFSASIGFADVNAPLPVGHLGQVGTLLGAGIIMGFGARTAGGCTSGHGMCGMSLGSPASIISTMTFFATAVALAHAMLWAEGAR